MFKYIFHFERAQTFLQSKMLQLNLLGEKYTVMLIYLDPKC